MPTAPPSSPVDICNLALDYLAQDPITSIETPTTQAESVMARWYDHVRQIVLREFMWNFAKKYAVLPLAGPATGTTRFTNAYNKPNDFIRLNWIGVDPEEIFQDYDIVEGQIYANYGNPGSTLPLCYNKDVTEVASFDPLFTNIFALRLALKVAYKFTLKKGKLDDIRAMLKEEEPKAISVDGQERVPTRVQHSRYLDARRGFGASRYASKYYDFS